jgi:3-hydroxybutyryl-CoA dehydrogenase
MAAYPPLDSRPVTLIGGGAMARLIGLTFAAGGAAVRVWARRPEAAAEVVGFVNSQVGGLAAAKGEGFSAGTIEAYDDMARAVAGAGLVIETVAEDPELKRTLLSDLDRLADPGAIVSSNSSSIPVSAFLADLKNPERVLNVHFHNPPWVPAVDVLGNGRTKREIIDLMLAELPKYGLVPFEATSQTSGFPFNRLMEALSREALQIVADGASTVEKVDGIWMADTGMPFGPFGLMDQVGLDVMAQIERLRRTTNPDLARWSMVESLEPYIAAGKLGVKTGEGFYRYGPGGTRIVE